MSDRTDAEALCDLVGDEYARCILEATSEGPKTATALGEHCDAALSTVYDRGDDLVETGVIEERTEVDADGSHRSVYALAVDGLTVSIAAGELRVELHAQQDASGRFTTMWNDIRGN